MGGKYGKIDGESIGVRVFTVASIQAGALPAAVVGDQSYVTDDANSGSTPIFFDGSVWKVTATLTEIA